MPVLVSTVQMAPLCGRYTLYTLATSAVKYCPLMPQILKMTPRRFESASLLIHAIVLECYAARNKVRVRGVDALGCVGMPLSLKHVAQHSGTRH